MVLFLLSNLAIFRDRKHRLFSIRQSRLLILVMKNLLLRYNSKGSLNIKVSSLISLGITIAISFILMLKTSNLSLGDQAKFG